MLRKLFPAWVVAAAVVVSCLPLRYGFPYGHDWIFELVRVAEYKHALSAGQYPPFWADNLYGGYGSPIFLFYAPLFMLVASAFAAVFDSIAWGATATLLSNRFPVMLGLTVLHAALSSVLGLHLGVWLDCSLAAAMVVAATGLFVLAWLASSGRSLMSCRVSDGEAQPDEAVRP